MTDSKALLLSALRCAVLRAELDSNELKTIGIALKADLITCEYAVTWLSDVGLISQVKAATLVTKTGGVVIDGDTGCIIHPAGARRP
jgi:hypothetical protein